MHPPPTIVRHQSFGSCYSTRSLVSSATGSSTRSHRRCRVEVGSILFGGTPAGGFPEQTADCVEIFARDRRAIKPCQERWCRTGPEQCSSRSHSSRARVPSDITLGSATSEVKKGKGKHQKGTFDHARVVDLIRQLSFSPSVSMESSSPAEELACSIVNEPPYCDGSTRDEPLVFEMEEDELVPVHRSPPLPPKILRLKLSEIPCFTNQVSRNCSCTQSTSDSEMNGSFIDVLGDTGNDASLHPSGLTINDATGEKSLITIITIENHASSALNLARQQPSSLRSRDRTPTFVSDQASYVSPCSSCDRTLHSFVEGEETEDQHDIVNCEHVLGHDSTHDENFNASGYERDNHVTDIVRPRLNSETLRQWNIFCEDEESKKEIITKDQLIFRCKTKDTLSPDLEKRSDDLLDDENNSVKESDLPLARSIFSYTNSCSSSNRFSQLINDEDEEISDLDFDMGFINTCQDSIVDSPISVNFSTFEVDLNTSHQRSQISRSQSGSPLRLTRRFKSV
jgi:hypothetical protein